MTHHRSGIFPFLTSAAFAGVVALPFAAQQLRVRDADLLCAPTAKLAWERVQ